MKLQTLTEGTVYDKASGLYKEFEKGGGKTSDIYHKCGFRVWTRGDGSRYKDMCSYYAQTKKGYNQLAKFWDLIESKPGRELRVKGEFGSSKYRDAKIVKGVLYLADMPWDHISSIEYASTSVLRNVDVWRSKDRE